MAEDDIPLELEAGHSSLPVRVPALGHLANAELSALREKINSVTRKSRREASKALCKDENVKRLWLATLSVGVDRDKAYLDFEAELLRHPEAFIAHAWANALTSLELAIRDEMLRRANTSVRKR